MANDQQPSTFDKISNVGSAIGAALTMIGGTPDQKARAKQILSANTPPGTPPPVFASLGDTDSGVNLPPTSSTPATPKSTPSPVNSGLSGLSGIGVSPLSAPMSNAPMGAGAGLKTSVPLVGTNDPSALGIKPLFP